MKRLITILAALILVSGAAFAGDFYNGDVQFQFGGALDSTKIQDMNEKITAKEGIFGFQSWHLFRPIELVGVGFMGGFNIGLGQTDQLEFYNSFTHKREKGNKKGFSFTYNFEIGPAVGIYLGEVVRFGANICYTLGFNIDRPMEYRKDDKMYEYNVWSEYKGFSAGLQAKFLPEKKCNPIVGWKLVKGYSDTTFGQVESTGYTTGKKEYDQKYDFTQNIFYAGLGISW